MESAANGEEALELIRRRDYDLVISDLKMPRADGRRLYEEVRRLKPALAARIIFTTGDVASPQTQAFFQETGAPFFVKPFDLEEVRREVGRVLQRS